MFQRTFWRSLVAVLTLVALVGQGTWVLAGTTGQLSGTLLDAQTSAPIADARVTAQSPSQQVTITTNTAGRFSFVSLAPDTYSVTVDKAGYDPSTVSGVTIQADQTQTLDLRANKRLQQIGTTRARANSDLVKAGTTADVYSVNAATQTAAQALGGGGSLNQAYSAIASVPGVYIPQGQTGWAQSVYVRGGDYTQLGYEFDGVPVQRAFDQYPGGTLSALGQQELQVYTGAAPADAASTGLAGFINQVIRTGTNPPYGNAELGVGAPTFYHKGQLEFGGAAKNRNFSYYLATAGYDQAYRFVDQYDGSQYNSTYGSLYNLVAQNCGSTKPSVGCYQNTSGVFGAFPQGPNGFAFGPFPFGFNDNNSDRESVVNLHFGLPHKNGTKDDVQLLYQNSWLRTNYATGLNYFGPNAQDVANGTVTQANGTVLPTCPSTFDPTVTQPPCALLGGTQPSYYLDNAIYTGSIGTKFTPANLSQLSYYPFPFSPSGRVTNDFVNPNHEDSYDIRTSIEKVQYQKNINERSFLRIYGYEFYSDWLQNGPDSANYNFVGGVSPNYQVGSHTRGASLSYVNQITDKHLLNFTGTYTYANTFRFNDSFINQPVAVLVNSLAPLNGLCYTAALKATYCGGSPARYVISGGALVHSSKAPTVGTEGALTCGTGPCEYLTVNSGQGGSYNTVAPRFTNLSLTDDWHPTSALTVNLGVKYDVFRYDLPPTDSPAGPLPQSVPAYVRANYVNSYNLFNCFSPAQAIVVSATSPGVCPAGSNPIQYSATSPGYNQYTAFSPRVGATYQTDPNNVFRVSYGKYVQPSSSAFQQYNTSQTNVLSGTPNRALLGLGVFSPTRHVQPETSYNLDGSWEHQFRGADTSFKLSPFYRTTQDEIVNVLLDPKTNFVSGINVGNKKVSGVELELRKGDFTRNGLAAQLSYTYTHGRIHFNKLPNGLTVVDAVNGSIAGYNAYTSFCAKNPKDGKCVDRLGNTVLPSNGATAAPCYTSGGAADPACAAGSIANPYWNAPAQGLFDAGSDFVVYNQLPGAGAASVSSSYIIPHVASLILNYKRDRWSITPSFQVAAGGQYGSPVNAQGIDPASNCGPLGAASPNGDPRYPYGAAGGTAYNAATCTGGIVTPNRFTGRFDNFGAFTEPTQITGNLQITYQASKNLTFRLTGANLLNTCFGGSKEPWNVGGAAGCWYTGSYLGDVGNFYNPGDTIVPAVSAPYGPSFAQVFQQTYGGQANPINVFLTASFKLF